MGERIGRALAVIEQYGMIGGEHHKQWVLDQVVRELTANGYGEWVGEMNQPNGLGEEMTPWDTGIAP